MASEMTDPVGVIQDIATYFGAAASTPDLASSVGGRSRADEATQADVQADVNDYFGVEGS